MNIDYDVTNDIEAIKTSFTKLQFKIDDAIFNPTAKEMIAHFKQEIHYFGCAAIFLFGHGGENYYYASDYNEAMDDGKLNAWEDVYDQFSGQNMPEMQKCPKLFFNEWCQITVDLLKKIESLKSELDSDDSDEEKPKRMSEGCRNTAHRIIYNAAQPKFRVPVGSHSTQVFCRLLDEHAESKHLEEILKLLMDQVGKQPFDADNYLHPIVYNTLISGKLYLICESKVYQLKSLYRKKFQEIEKIGEGHFGVVFRAKKFDDEVNYAVKRVQLEENYENIIREYRLLARFSNHSQIVAYQNVWYELAEFYSQRKEDHRKKVNLKLLNNSDTNIIHFCYIQMELCSATLKQWLREKCQYDRDKSLIIFQQIIQGLAHLHQNTVVHRDLKPSNVLFAITGRDSDLCIRIADFGLVKNIDTSTILEGALTQLYMAPEVFKGKINPKSDIYSAGLILLELLFNCSEDHENLLNNAKVGIFPLPFQNQLEFAVSTLKKLLSFNSDDRPSSDDLLKILSKKPEHWNKTLESISNNTTFYILDGSLDKEDNKYYLGRVRIFINCKFKNHLEFNIKHNFFHDVQAIKNTFHNLQFKVAEPIINQKAEDMISCFREDIDYFGCVVTFVLSHGDQNYIFGTDYDEKTGSGRLNIETYSDTYQRSYSTEMICQRLNEYAQTKDLDYIFNLVCEDVEKIRIGFDLNMQPLLSSTLDKKLYLLPEEKVDQHMSIYEKEFKHVDLLGRGRFGVVFKATNINDGIIYAVKRIQLKDNTASAQWEISREIDYLSEFVKCDQIVQYKRVWYESAEFKYLSKQDDRMKISALSKSGPIVHLCYIQMELCGDSLEKWLKEKNHRDRFESLNIFKQIVQGLAYIHNKNLVHRNIKPSNIRFAITNKDRDLHIRIADFAFTKNVGNFSTTTSDGKILQYMAPEMLKGKFETKSDMYSAGLILIELLFNCSTDHENILNKAKDGVFPESFKNELKFVVPMLKKLLSFNYCDRHSSNELLVIFNNDPNWNEDLTPSTSNKKNSLTRLFRKKKKSLS